MTGDVFIPKGPMLLDCPFCGKRPAQGPTKVEYCQLHGEPLQRFRVWCPHGCADISGPDRDAACERWNKRESADALEAQATEIDEQCRLNGMGSEREARLMAELEGYKRACRQAGICISCIMGPHDPMGCTDCLGTSWDGGAPAGYMPEAALASAHADRASVLKRAAKMADDEADRLRDYGAKMPSDVLAQREYAASASCRSLAFRIRALGSTPDAGGEHG